MNLCCLKFQTFRKMKIILIQCLLKIKLEKHLNPLQDKSHSYKNPNNSKLKPTNKSISFCCYQCNNIGIVMFQ